MTRRRAAWLIARHVAIWPWPRTGEPPIPSGHPWLDGLAWLREAPSRRWLITVVWLAVAVATAGAGLAMATVLPVLWQSAANVPQRRGVRQRGMRVPASSEGCEAGTQPGRALAWLDIRTPGGAVPAPCAAASPGTINHIGVKP